MSASTTLRLCRRILRELKRANPEANTGGAQWQYITSQVRSHDHAMCKEDSSLHSHDQQLRLMRTYLSYLESSRKHRELLSTYQGKGERSVEESARLVGLELPKTPGDPS